MSWFRRSSRASHANRLHSESDLRGPEGKGQHLDMSKSLCSLDERCIERLEPEEFFHDPDHVRHYKEEAVFLSIMAEWEIVEHPSQENYFSADFEEELLQRHTHTHTSRPTHPDVDLEQDVELSKPLSLSGVRRKRKFYELLFVDNIQTGILLPDDNGGCMPRSPRTESSAAHCKKSKYASSQSSGLSSISMDTSLSNRTCPKQVLKDCRINRKQLKTEALAGSIMGAIGKCPSKDETLATTRASRNTNSNLNSNSNCSNLNDEDDACHPAELNTCDHYDIKKFFRLDDQGNILLNMSHIEECRGFGFAATTQTQSRRLYRRYRRRCECIDEDYCRERGCCALLQRVLCLFWQLMSGHPRNKINVHSAGPGDTLRAYTLQLARDPSSTFARNIENFICCTKESREAAPQVIMRNMRQFMSGMKNYLVKHGEGKFHAEMQAARTRLKADEFLNLDAILETVMHQLVVLPLREHLYGIFVDYYKRSEDIQLLAQNVKYACERDPVDFGIRPTVTPPSQSALRIIANLLWRLQEAELPLDKLELFLCVISTVFDATGCPRGQQLGADDFLPVLVYVVAKCGFVGAEIEAEFMWGLLQPTLLNGEPGYYLTALCSAVQVLKTFMSSENESGSGSLDWRAPCLPACSSVLRVIIPNECNGSLQTRTLPVRPHTTTREVCRIIAHKARITNPQDYALFKLVDGEETLLTDAECPQDVRLAAKGKHCMLAYKRIDAKIAWPTATQPSN
ncbi:protein sprint isoform X4 [Scaptodrosophila lebanonensis]|uniref:Protein sprint isoform X4 n=1 Tax=Drosophila lebanonensis TaxID=7225 RepID=A0A6J2U0K3_DROLE|nr:protein sprint isoform X4 [Scaptodrosophila lebanonensis]